VLAAHERQQLAEMTLLGNSDDKNTSEPHDVTLDEDYFTRAMLQRDVEGVQMSMKKVQAIYQDLAGLVEEQQSPIDQLQEAACHAKQNTKKGLEHIQQAKYSLCGDVWDVAEDDNELSGGNRTSDSSRASFSWATPFEYIGETALSCGRRFNYDLYRCTPLPQSSSWTSLDESSSHF